MIQFAKALYDRFNLLCSKVDSIGARLLPALDDIARIREYVSCRPIPVVLSARGKFNNGSKTEPGTLGRFLWMTPGARQVVSLQPQVTFDDIEVFVEGGAVINDISIGNVSQVVGYHEGNAILRVKCSRGCEVGSQIKVTLEVPRP